MSSPGEERLQRGYRVLRRVMGGTEAPWAGVMVATETHGAGVLVDVATLPESWRGWDAAASGHVLAPLDVVRRADGHDVLLPVCPERVIDLLDRRRSARTPPSTGEGVTVSVSLLRGLCELVGGDAAQVAGEWWLTDSGRPVFATDIGDRSTKDATVELLTNIADRMPLLADPVTEAIKAVQRGSITREIDRIEATLFAATTPEPLATTVIGPALSGPASAHRAAREIDERTPYEDPGARPSWVMGLTRHVDADWADALSRATTGVWRALRDRRGHTGHRRPLIAATLVAGVILIGGFMWPVSDDAPATAGAAVDASLVPTPLAVPADAESPAEPTEPESGEASGADISTDLAAIAADLLTRRSDCINDDACLTLVVESPDSSFPTGAVDLAAEARNTALVDEFGGVAVFRVDAVDESLGSQLVVIVRVHEKWLLRDVYDVTQ